MRLGRTFSAKPALIAALACGGALVLAGCDERVRIIRDPDLRVAKHATWAWQPMTQRGGTRDSRAVTSRDLITRGETVARDTSAENEVLRGKVKNAIEETLNTKGMRFVSDPQAADFLVDFHLGVRRRSVTVEHVYPGYPGLVCGPYGCWEGWGWGPTGVSYENIRFREGTIVLDLVQHDTNHLAYRAIGEKPVRRDMLSFSQDEVNGMVHRLLKDLRARK